MFKLPQTANPKCEIWRASLSVFSFWARHAWHLRHSGCSSSRSRRRRGRSPWWSSLTWTGGPAHGEPNRARNRLRWWNPTSAATAAPSITVSNRSTGETTKNKNILLQSDKTVSFAERKCFVGFFLLLGMLHWALRKKKHRNAKRLVNISRAKPKHSIFSTDSSSSDVSTLVRMWGWVGQLACSFHL